MSDAWPEEAVSLVQAVADTKIMLSQRYAEWMLSGPALEDDIAGANAAQDEIGHVRQLFRLLEAQGKAAEWLEGERSPEEYANAKSLDADADDWTEFAVGVATADWAAWLLLDAITHDDFAGMVTKMGEDEYFHVEHHDGRLETLAESDPEGLEAAFESVVPDVLAFLGPADYDAEGDPLVDAGFTDRPATELHAAFFDHYEQLFEGTDVSLDGIDHEGPSESDWDAERRRVGGGAIDQDVVESFRGGPNKEFAMQ